MNTYTFHINLYDAAFFGMLFIGLTIAVFLWFTKKMNQAANRFLALAMVTIVLWIARLLGIDIGLSTYIPNWSRLPFQFSLALGPLIYFYVLKITLPDYKFRWKDLLHFSPLLLELGAQAWEVRDSIKTSAATYETAAFRQLNPVLNLLAFISVIIYLYLAHQRIERFYLRIKFSWGDRYRTELQWLHRLLIGFGLLWLLWIPFTVVNYIYFHGQLSAHAYYPLYLLLAVAAIWAAASAFLRPEVGVLVAPAPSLKPPLPAEMKEMGTWLKKAMQTGLYYQDPDLSLSVLAEKLELTTHELSRIINTALKKSFNDFINEYRVADVVQKMQDPAYDHITLLGIAYESGFNAQSTFSRIFKQMTGKTPLEYKNDVKKDFPSYNSRSHQQFAPVILHREATPRWSHEKLNRNYMFKIYLKAAFRGLMKNKGFAFTNIFGLALGLATCMLIVFYVFDELSYDRYNTKADRIYRLNEDVKFGGSTNSYAISPAPMAAALKNDFPEIEQVVRFWNKGGNQVKKGTQNINERMVYADPSIFSVFTLPMISGSPSSALTEPHSVVITERTAKKYFDGASAGYQDVVGKVLIVNDTIPYKITGVIRDIPQQSHFNFDFFLSMAGLPESRNNNMLSNNFNTYILLKPGADYKKLESKFPDFFRKHAGAQLESTIHSTFAKFEQSGDYFRMNLTPLKDIHLKSNRLEEMRPNGNIQYVYIFSAIALFILLIACINFMNLSTARSSNRAREVGVRKVLGSPRKYLIAQFLAESIMITLFAALIALFAAWALLPLFNQMAGKELMVTSTIVKWIVPVLLAIVIVVGCLAGSYPAFFLSGFQPIEVLKGKLTAGFKGGGLRRFLVVFQFAISIFLIIGTLVIYNQLKFIQNKDLGYDRDHLLVVNNLWTFPNSVAKTFKGQIKPLAGVKDLSLSQALPTWNYGSSNIFFKDKIFDQKRSIVSRDWGVDEDYIPTLGIKMAAGRNFSKDMLTDSTGLVINKAAANLLGYTNPLNQMLYLPQGNKAETMKAYHIIGVMNDFNFRSLRENVAPLIFMQKQKSNALSVRFKSADIPLLLSQIKDKWKEIYPNQPFYYSFLEDDFNAIYRTEQRTGTISIAFTSLAIIIACLGLFGLAAYAAEQRTKEIGIRKVLGANVTTIVALLSRDFLFLVLVSIVVASPVAWWFMQTWFLQGFAYRQNIQWWVFASAGLTAIVIALITVSFQAIKAAVTNPVKSLRSLNKVANCQKGLML